LTRDKPVAVDVIPGGDVCASIPDVLLLALVREVVAVPKPVRRGCQPPALIAVELIVVGARHAAEEPDGGPHALCLVGHPGLYLHVPSAPGQGELSLGCDHTAQPRVGGCVLVCVAC